MFDVGLVLLVLAVVLIISAIAFAVEHIGKCKHDWSKWSAVDAEFAYVQQRWCTKCGYIETEQFRKITQDAQ
jgi:hypothetical protein